MGGRGRRERRLAARARRVAVHHAASRRRRRLLLLLLLLLLLARRQAELRAAPCSGSRLKASIDACTSLGGMSPALRGSLAADRRRRTCLALLPPPLDDSFTSFVQTH